MSYDNRVDLPRFGRWAMYPPRAIVLFVMLEWVLIVAFHFPYWTDREAPARRVQQSSAFYDQAYQPTPASVENNEATPYEHTAKEAAEMFHIEAQLKQFALLYGLQSKKVLEVGAGRGYLQDIVPDYTALDISPSARRHFHKPFVQASATEMPFTDGEFDAVWTIWVLEHVPGPQNALMEMRRVLKDGGVLFLLVAWNCTSWAADGYDVRPYSDFGWSGKLTKASIAIRGSPLFRAAHIYPARALRSIFWRVSASPTSLHYHLLSPNYTTYWQADSDAVNSIDPHEAYLWFLSRGDECLNCNGEFDGLIEPGSLIIRIHKPATGG